MEERKIQLESTKYVDEVVIYNTEEELKNILKNKLPDVRILGSGAKGKTIIGEEYCKEIYYHERNHNWSSSELRKRFK